MDVHVIDADGLTKHTPDELPALLTRADAVVWVDIPLCETQHADVLTRVFGFAELAVRGCVERNHISQGHLYDDHLFTVLHAPELGRGGHVHYVELDQFVGPNYVVTVHGPLNPVVDRAVAQIDTDHVLARIKAGTLHPRTPMALSAAIVSAMIRREIDLVAKLARESGRLEQQVTDEDHDDDPEALLEQLFEVGHQLLAIRTIVTHSAETYRNLARRGTRLAEADAGLVVDLADRFDMVRSMAEGQREFVHGVIEFFQTRTSTHLAVAAQELADTSAKQNDQMQRITAWVAIIAVPTAVTGWFGQNVPYPGYGTTAGFVASTVIIVVAALALYVLFRWKRWL
ncbi:MAG: magnesium transporter CorA family protein [Jatrophihabitans sp.]|uniref:magnesium transporter CorA family protein n=1 Tax=Jatrophihabitans sp. TaxID=1932789 RepID=UPI003F8091CE